MEALISNKTKRFIQLVKSLEEQGSVRNREDIIKKLKWNKGSMSQVMNERVNVPKHIYAQFIKVYGSYLDADGENQDHLDDTETEYGATYLELLESHRHLSEAHLIQMRIMDRITSLLEARQPETVSEAKGEIPQQTNSSPA